MKLTRFGTRPALDESPEFIGRIAESVALLNRLLDEGKTIYGTQPAINCGRATIVDCLQV